jgi:hypothetical protein
MTDEWTADDDEQLHVLARLQEAAQHAGAIRRGRAPTPDRGPHERWLLVAASDVHTFPVGLGARSAVTPSP